MLLISGSTRAGSTSTAVLRTLAELEPDHTSMYTELAALPAFDPDLDRDPLPPVVARLRAALGAAQAVLFCTPEYAGALPGSFKNLLDWTVGGAEMPGLPVGWVNVASVAAPSGGAGAHGELRTVLGYVQARVVEEACRRHPLGRGDVGPDGRVADPDVHRLLREVLSALAGAASD